MHPFPHSEIDKVLQELAAKKDEWAMLPASEVLALATRIRADTEAVADAWVEACAEGKGVADNPYAIGEEWTLCAAVGRMLRILERSLGDIAQGRAPRLPKPLSVNDHGRVVAEVFPASTIDTLSLPGMRAEVWMTADETLERAQAGQAMAYKYPPASGKVSLVLAAGNVSALVPGDMVQKLFVERSVVVLKPNPVNEYLGPIVEKAFRALIERGYLTVVYGGAEQGQYLAAHDLVDTVHVTGSEKTFDALVFGSGETGTARKRRGEVELSKPVTAELGTVAPVIVVPGPWKADEVRSQGHKLATWLTVNAGCNCLTPRLVIQQQSWEHRDALNDAVREGLSRIDTRPAFYPGADARLAAFVEAHPDAWQTGSTEGGHLPWTHIADVDPENTGDISFTTEPFSTVMSETALDGDGTAEFLSEAVRFANERVWGTLVAILLVHPAALKDPDARTAVDRAISNLEYGSVMINTFPGLGWALASAPWGSAPGQSIYDIQSGTGVVNNLLMFRRPAKLVVYGPFTQMKEIFSPNFSKMEQFGRSFAALQAKPSFTRLARLMWAIMTG
jgi:acyl-CoA reductase-like NAD-dependent aldehyde dehydrogenase